MQNLTPDSSITFTTPDGQSHAVDFCDPNLNLLAHAQAIELDLGSTCGGHGICGKDRVQVTSPSLAEQSQSFSVFTDAERQHLTEHELNSGIRLACQCFPEVEGMHLRIRKP